MAAVVYQVFKLRNVKGDFPLSSANIAANKIRALLVKTTSTVDTEPLKDTLSGFTALAECDVAGYSRQTPTGVAVARNDGSLRVEVDCNDVSFGEIVGGNTLKGVLFYEYVDGTNANDIPIAFCPFASNVTTDGNVVRMSNPSFGWLQAT